MTDLAHRIKRFGKQLVANEIAFLDCDLAGVDLSKAEIVSSTFRGGTLKGARFREAVLYRSIFDGCDVEGADFNNANVRWAAFLTNHEAASFEGADLTRTAWNVEQKDQNFRDFFPSRGDPEKLWPRATLKPR